MPTRIRPTVLLGGPRGLGSGGTGRWTQDTQGVPGPAVEGDELGFALGAMDTDGDGRDDLVIGVPGDRVNGRPEAGLVLVLRGSAAGPTSVGASAWSMATPGIRGLATRRDRFGSQVGG